MLKIVIVGSRGRMGLNLIEEINQDSELLMHAGIDRSNQDRIVELSEGADLMIDFSSPNALGNNLMACSKNGLKLVLGTTGLNGQQFEEVERFSYLQPTIVAANYSLGINLLLKLLELAVATLPESYDIDIIESHHRFKRDFPSGTALEMGRSIANALGKDFNLVKRMGSGGERRGRNIHFSHLRRGGVVGEHQALFSTIGEEISISHRASSRSTFAKGAVQAAKWLSERREARIYSMSEVLGIQKG